MAATDQWPPEFEAFDGTSLETAHAWITSDTNSQFNKWRNRKGEAKDWDGLEFAISTLVGLEKKLCSSLSKQGAESALATPETPKKNSPGKRGLKSRKIEVGNAVCRCLLKASDTLWKELPEFQVWLCKACIALAARTIYLYKRSRARKNPKDDLEELVTGNKREVEDQDEDLATAEGDKYDEDGDTSMSGSRTITSTANSQADSVQDTPRRPKSLSKRPRLSYQPTNRNSIARSLNTRDEFFSDNKHAWQRLLLVQKMILILIDENVCDLETSLQWAGVCIDAIVVEDIKGGERKDIRCEHLSWELFVNTLRGINKSLDLLLNQNVMMVYQRDVGGEQEQLEVNEVSFTNVVGLMEYESGLKSKWEPLTMRLIAR